MPHQNSKNNLRERTVTLWALVQVPVHIHWHSVLYVGQFQLSFSFICSQYNHFKRVRGHKAHKKMTPCRADLQGSLEGNDDGENGKCFSVNSFTG